MMLQTFIYSVTTDFFFMLAVFHASMNGASYFLVM